MIDRLEKSGRLWALWAKAYSHGLSVLPQVGEKKKAVITTVVARVAMAISLFFQVLGQPLCLRRLDLFAASVGGLDPKASTGVPRAPVAVDSRGRNNLVEKRAARW